LVVSRLLKALKHSGVTVLLGVIVVYDDDTPRIFTMVLKKSLKRVDQPGECNLRGVDSPRERSFVDRLPEKSDASSVTANNRKGLEAKLLSFLARQVDVRLCFPEFLLLLLSQLWGEPRPVVLLPRLPPLLSRLMACGPTQLRKGGNQGLLAVGPQKPCGVKLQTFCIALERVCLLQIAELGGSRRTRPHVNTQTQHDEVTGLTRMGIGDAGLVNVQDVHDEAGYVKREKKLPRGAG
jgi:hypothetical protein